MAAEQQKTHAIVEKSPATSHSTDEEAAERPRPLDKFGTIADHRDMIRMGKRPELNRNFRFFSILGFTCILMSTWEGQLIASVFGLLNGGLAGLIWTYIGTFIGFLAVTASMAEMASMAPTSGGQYHWVSEFAPESAQKFLSYLTGWVCVLGWQTNVTSVAFIAAQQIQSLIVIFDSNYIFERWQGTLLIIAISFLSIIFNSYLAKRLPMIENIILILHITGFFAILIPLWAMAPRNSAKMVFTQFKDGATHMAEEIEEASYVLPRAMMWTVVVNGTLGFAMLVTFCFCLGNVDDILANPNIMPFVQVFFNATKSEAGTSILMTIFIILTTCGCISQLATASRQMFAFARDNGLPCSKFLARVQPGWDIPLHSVIVSFCITILLSLINIGSTTAFNALASLGTAALLSSYIISITCLRIKRWRRQPLPPMWWSTGKWGALINDFSIAYLVLIFIFCFFPQATPVTPPTMNWNILIYGFVVCFAIGYYYVKGRHVYDGPMKLVRKDI